MDTFNTVVNLFETFMPSHDVMRTYDKKRWKEKSYFLMHIIIGMFLANQATAEQIKAIKEKMENV